MGPPDLKRPCLPVPRPHERHPMVPIHQTGRGFDYGLFLDCNGEHCSIQQSSAIDDTERGLDHPGSSFLWLGIDPDHRMHLSREGVQVLVSLMQRWLATGSLQPTKG